MLSFNGDPALEGAQAVSFWERGAVRIEDGIISAVGNDRSVPETVSVTDYGDRLICAGFVDGHVHYPQINIVASYGKQLLDWLTTYTFPEEIRFSDPAIARAAAKFFLDELSKNGFTTAAVYCSSHPVSVDAFFTEASERNLKL